MDLQITGNIAELNRTVEGFRNNCRIEMDLKNKQSVKAVCAIAVILISIHILFSVLFEASLVFVLCVAAAIIVFTIILFLIAEPKTKDKIENEVNSATRNMFGDRQIILEKYLSGTILLAEIISTDNITLRIRFDCEGNEDSVESYYFEPRLLRKTSDMYSGRLTVDIQRKICIYYYLDKFKAGDQLTIVN